MNAQQTADTPCLRFAIIIPVIHSLEDLGRCMASLTRLEYPRDNFRVVLVDCRVVWGLETFLNDLSRYNLTITTLALPDVPPLQLDWLIDARINEARNTAIRHVAAQYYVFTEDDCTFEPDWLCKFERAVYDEIGALGGPDILPKGMTGFPKTLDCLLNSMLGTAGMRKREQQQAAQYIPRKENMLIPGRVLERVGLFPENKPLGGEMDMAGRIHDAGLEVAFLAENPVWHRRVTTIPTFLRLTSYVASQKVLVQREQHRFFTSLHFFVLLAMAGVVAISGLAVLWPPVRIVLLTGLVLYGCALLATSCACALKTRDMRVGIDLCWLIPCHHLSIGIGIIKGVFQKISATKETL